MNQDNDRPEGQGERLPEAIIAARSRISVIWLVPLAAVLVGAWLVFKTYSEQGTQIVIQFKTAEGLIAGKTRIKLKDVEVGTVEEVRVSEDLGHVEARARIERWAEKHITKGTRFWIERPRIAAGRVSGLGTLMSGTYVGMDPGRGGAPERQFVGLEVPPVVTGTEAGRRFVLQAPGLGSLNIGSPVTYRQIEVGQVAGFKLDPAGDHVDIRVFIAEPYDSLVRTTTRFWNTSGVNLKMSADGFQLDTESLVSVLIGGIAFDNPASLEPAEGAEADHPFPLYPSHEATRQVAYTRRESYLLYFDGSVRGLTVGAPVEFRGIKIGEVMDVRLQLLADDYTLRVPVLIQIQPDRIEVVGDRDKIDPSGGHEGILKLVEKGLRAQLKTGSLLTGQLYVDFDFHPEAPPAVVREQGDVPVLPTVPSPLEAITSNLTRLLGKLEALPLDEIGDDLRDAIRAVKELVGSEELVQAVRSFNAMMREGERAGQQINGELIPALDAALGQTRQALAGVSAVVTPTSPLYTEIQRMLRELTDAARSIRVMADYLERHPEALISGKGGRR